MYVPNSSLVWTEDFVWDKLGNNLFDENSSRWNDKHSDLYVKDMEFYEWGDLRLILSNGHMLEVFANTSFKRLTEDSLENELWRFMNKQEEFHMVMTGGGAVLS